MDKESVGVHKTHCCIDHGCKYGKDNKCPVYRAEVEQEYDCEFCRDENPQIPDKEIQALKADIISLVPIHYQEYVRQKVDQLINTVVQHSEIQILNSPFKFLDHENIRHSNTEEEE